MEISNSLHRRRIKQQLWSFKGENAAPSGTAEFLGSISKGNQHLFATALELTHLSLTPPAALGARLNAPAGCHIPPAGIQPSSLKTSCVIATRKQDVIS